MINYHSNVEWASPKLKIKIFISFGSSQCQKNVQN